MKTLREYINLIEAAETPVDEGIKSALAGAAMTGAMMMSPGQAQAQEPPTWQSQVLAAMKAGEVPQSNSVSIQRQGGWVTSVTVNGRTYDISHRIPSAGQQDLDAARKFAMAMNNEDQLEETTPDAMSKIDALFRNS